MKIFGLTALLVLAAACGGAPNDVVQAPPNVPSAEPTAVAAAPSAAPSAAPVDDAWIVPGPAFDASPLFADQKLDGIAKKLEGAWVINQGGYKEAWQIKGNVATVVNSNGTSAYAFKVTSPCTLEMKRKDGMSIESHFATDGDDFYTALGDFGVKQKDGSVIACVSNGVYVWKKNKCEKHMLLGGWQTEAAKCAVTKEGFEVSGDTGGKLTLTGNLLLGNEPEKIKAERVADLAAGKAKIAK